MAETLPATYAKIPQRAIDQLHGVQKLRGEALTEFDDNQVLQVKAEEEPTGFYEGNGGY